MKYIKLTTVISFVSTNAPAAAAAACCHSAAVSSAASSHSSLPTASRTSLNHQKRPISVNKKFEMIFISNCNESRQSDYTLGKFVARKPGIVIFLATAVALGCGAGCRYLRQENEGIKVSLTVHCITVNKMWLKPFNCIS